jgi:hypothetical protein
MSIAEKELHGATFAKATGEQNYGAIYRMLRRVQRPFSALCFWIEQQCARIETKREVARWNRKQ